MKQKMNNVRMQTITLPYQDGNSTSPFHTYCAATRQGNIDHTPVIEWYPNEINELMTGKKNIIVRFVRNS